MEFLRFKKAMQAQFANICKFTNLLYVTDTNRDEIWDVYLNSFSEELRKENTCNSCKSFLRQYGNIVMIDEQGNLISIWDFFIDEKNPIDVEFNFAAENLSKYVKSKPVVNVFVNGFTKLGVDKNRDMSSGTLVMWEHLYFEIPAKFVNRGGSDDSVRGTYNTTQKVMFRSLNEITMDAIETVLELINQNSIYRGFEFKTTVEQFKIVKRQFDAAPNKVNFTWRMVTNTGMGHMRNSAIGTLLVNLSEGMELDIAVNKFEAIMAPANYKRPTALITKKMIDDAQKKIVELDLLDSLPRRHATIDDITVNNVLFANRDAKVAMNVFEELKEEAAVNPRSFSKIEEVTIEEFIKNVLPTATAVELLFENKHINNLMTLTAPVNKDAKSLFKWDNGFSWSYNGDVADSIKERVKAAGGKVDGELRCSLSWHNYDDLDIHVVEPNGHKIFYGDKRSNTSGTLDVDMNAGHRESREPVENIIWTDPKSMLKGKYSVLVNNFNKRESNNGFEVEVECKGVVYNFTGDNPGNNKTTTVFEFNYDPQTGITPITSTSGTVKSTEVWKSNTNTFNKVSLMMTSPNHWDDNNKGNKHYFFILEGCENPNSVRGFYNEYLNESLTPHRKVFEVLGDKMKTPFNEQQLSGLGFSETSGSSVICKVIGKTKRTIKINF